MGSAAETEAEELLTTGQVAARLGFHPWQVRSVYNREKVPRRPRLGNTRVFHAGDLPAVERALREAGYLPAVEAGKAGE